MTRMHNPPHPGELLTEWLSGLKDEGVTIASLSRHIGVTRATLSRIVHGHGAITPEMAIKLEEALGPSREMWLGMQTAYDLWQAAQKHRRHIKPIAHPVIEEALECA
jgi:addiction module HigA family antidote